LVSTYLAVKKKKYEKISSFSKCSSLIQSLLEKRTEGTNGSKGEEKYE